MKYSTILFDLDDTLLDFGKAEERAVKLLMEKYNIPPTKENRELYIKMNKAKWAALEKHEITRDDLFSKRFTEYFEAVGIVADGIKANDEYITFLSEGHFLIEGALEVCEELSKECQLYIITNGAKKAQYGRLTGSPLMKYIKDVFISEEIGADKPDKEFFSYVLERIPEKDIRKIIIVGDSLYSDIAGGINSGIDTCWLNRGEHIKNGANFEISDISQLKKI
jgi:2-haloacid dehalogenase